MLLKIRFLHTRLHALLGVTYLVLATAHEGVGQLRGKQLAPTHSQFMMNELS